MRRIEVVPAGLVALTFATGAIDAASFLGLGRVFTANMTGNVVLLGFGLAGASGFTIQAPVVSLGGFLVGAAGGGLLAGRLEDRRRLWLPAALGAELTSLVAAAVVSAVAFERYAIIAILGVGMGVRNATVRALDVPDLTTTVLTRTLTALAADLDRGSARRFVAVAAMLLGALVGAVLVLHGHLTACLVLTAVVVAGTLVAYALRA